MYTSYIGKKFLTLYRQKKNLPDDYSARQFFDEVLFPLFFDDEKHLMQVHNSSFFQKVSNKDLALGKTKPRIQLERLHKQIESGILNGSTYVGNASKNSRQVTSMAIDFSQEDTYSSWIGEALAIGVGGGICILTEKAEVLWSLFKGWFFYRTYINQTPIISRRQIETWNGHWLCHSFQSYFEEDEPLRGYNLPIPVKLEGKSGIPTIGWQRVIFALSKKYPNEIITVYAYGLSRENTTLGFINLYLPKVRKLIHLKGELYTLSDDGRRDADFEKMYNTYFTFKNACKQGVIGLKTLEPDKLREYMPMGSVTFAKSKDYKFSNPNIKPKKDEEAEKFEERKQKAQTKHKNELINFQIYKIWIMAMLNNKKELNALAEQVAQALINYEQKSSDKKRGKTAQESLTDAVKSSKHLRAFIDNLD